MSFVINPFVFGTVAAQAYTTRVPLNTSTGIQEITIAGLGFTPKAAIFTLSRATADGTPVGGGIAGSIGFASSSSDQSACGFKTPTQDKIGSTTDCIIMPANTGANTIVARAALDSFISNGCRINITTAPASGYLLTVRFFGAGVVAAKAGKLDFPNATTSTITPGLRAHVLFVVMQNAALTGSFVGSPAALGMGFMTNDGTTIRQVANYTGITSPGGTYQVDGRVNTGMVAAYGAGGPSVSNITATAFNLTTSLAIGSTDAAYLALELTDPTAAWCGALQTSASTGNQDLTGPSFTPSSLMIAPSTYTSLNTTQTDGHGGGFGFSMIDGAQYCNGWSARDNSLSSSGSDQQSVSDDRAVNVYTHDGGAIAAGASLVGFSSGKATLNFTNTNGEAYYWPCLFTNGI